MTITAPGFVSPDVLGGGVIYFSYPNRPSKEGQRRWLSVQKTSSPVSRSEFASL